MIIFNELIKQLLDPNENWILEKNKLYLKKDRIFYVVDFYGEYKNIDFIINSIPLKINNDERKILAKAITFLRGNMPKSINNAVDQGIVNFKGFSISEYYPVGGRRSIKVLIEKEKKRRINKKQFNTEFYSIPQDEEIFESTGFGTIGDLFNNLQQNEISYDIKLEKDEKPYFKIKSNKKNETQVKIVESLVLWDIENVNFFDDVAIISRYLKTDNQLKCVSFYQKHKSSKIFLSGDVDFKLNKLRKRNWIVLRTKGIADNSLIENFHKYKNSLKELILITADSDFANIAKEAESLGIKVIIINNAKIKNISWFKNYEYIYLSS